MLRGNKRCSKGKSCGASCISRMKVCLLELRETLSKDMGKLTHLVAGPKETASGTSESTPTPEPKTKEPKQSSGSLESAFQGEEGKALYKSILDDLEEIKSEFKPGEMQDVAASQFRQSREFAKRLESSLPPGVKAKMDEKEDHMIVMTTKTKSGDEVKVFFSPKRGFHFQVNGETDAGSVTDPEARVQVTLAVRSIFRATASSLPQGSVMRTAAHMEDGKGQRRIDIYNGKLGFSLPDGEGNMYGRVGSGRRLESSDRDGWVDQARDRSAVFFSEANPSEGFGSVKDWYQIIFGTELKGV